MNPVGLVALEFILKTTLLLAFAWVATRLLVRSSAAMRHLVWLVAYVSIFALPVAEALLPGRTVVQIPAWSSGSRTSRELKAGSQEALSAPAVPIDQTLPRVKAATLALSTQPEAALIPAARPIEAFQLWTCLAAAWGIGTALIGLRWVLGVLCTRANRLGVSSPALASLAETVGVRRQIRVRMARAAGPAYAMTYGVLRPVILLPRSANSWPPQRLKSVLVHELAHVRRLDWLWQTIASLGCALHWFNPLAWLSLKAMRNEAEAATDDFVLSLGCTPSIYARDLLEVAAELSHRHALIPVTGVTVMKSPQIEHRIQAILDKTRNRRGVTTLEVLLAASLALGLVGPLSAVKLGPPRQKSKVVRTSQHQSRDKVIKLMADGNRTVQVTWFDPSHYRIMDSKGKARKLAKNEVLILARENGGLVELDRNRDKIRYRQDKASVKLQKVQLEVAEEAQVRAMKSQQDGLLKQSRARLAQVGAKALAMAAQQKALAAQDTLRGEQAEEKANLAKALRDQTDLVRDREGLVRESADLATVKDQLDVAKAQYKEAEAEKAVADLEYKDGSAPLKARAEQEARALRDLKLKSERLAGKLNAADPASKALADRLDLASRDSLGDPRLNHEPSGLARANIEKAKAELDFAASKFEQTKKLYEQGAMPKGDFDSAKKDLTIAKLNLRIAILESRDKN